MGTLYFGARHEFPFEDRTLNHLRSVIASKLIQHESFALTWEDEGVQRPRACAELPQEQFPRQFAEEWLHAA